MPPKPKRRPSLSPAHAAARRKAREELAERDRALQQWLALQLAGDAATAHLVWWVGTLHAGLAAWQQEARRAHVLPTPGGMASLSGTPDPDSAVTKPALSVPPDAADLERLREQTVTRVYRISCSYTDQGLPTWHGGTLAGDIARWTGDPELAQFMASCIVAHAELKRRGDGPRRKAAEKRWRDLAAWSTRQRSGWLFTPNPT